MKKDILRILSLFASILSIQIGYGAIQDGIEVNVITNCSGTQVVRVAPGKFEIRYVEPNTPGCVRSTNNQSPSLSSGNSSLPNTSPIATGSYSSGDIFTGSLQNEIVNCNGTRVRLLSNGGYAISYGEKNLPGCIRTDYDGRVISGPDLSRGPLLDLASTDIINYRIELLKSKRIRFANAIRSVRMRNMASMKSRTNAYLMRNDAVIVEGKETGWVKTQGATLEVVDTQENTVEGNTTGKASGYIAGKYLRDPNVDDLVRIEQADHAYWSDLAHVNVRYANVRVHPWYGAPIVGTIGKGYMLYVITTVDNWSEVRNDSGSIRGYIRSDLITVDHIQRRDTSNTSKKDTNSNDISRESDGDSSWIGF